MDQQQQQQAQEKKQVIVVVEGGWVQEVTHPGDVQVIIHDYDLDGTEAPATIHDDEDGKKYKEEVWNG